MKSVDLKCASIDKSLVVQVVIYEGISGFAQAETYPNPAHPRLPRGAGGV